MSNPFDDEDGSYLVLMNQEGRHSLWPDFADPPSGWAVRHGPAGRQECVEYIEANWPGIVLGEYTLA